MKYIENNYVMTIIPSKQHFRVWYILLAFIHVLITVVLFRLSWSTFVIVGVSIVSYFIFVIFTLNVKLPSYQLDINERGSLQYREQIKFNGKLLGSSFCTNWFIWLCFEREYDDKVIRLLVWKDALDNQSFRRLSRIIRLKRQMI